MWGNLQGWAISVLMLLVTAGLLYLAAQPAAESTPAGLISGAYQPIALPTDPATLEIPSGTKDCDAGPLYQQAIEQYQNDPKAYANAARSDASLPAVQLILQASDCSKMHLFDTHLTQAINYNDHKPWIEALGALGQATNDTGLRLRDDHPDEARRCYQAAFLLGRRLYDERIAWPEVSQGLSIMSMSARNLSQLAERSGDKIAKKIFEDFEQQTDRYHSDLQEKTASPLSNPVESYASQFAGDIFAIARNPAAPRLWRVEAILHMGRYKWNVATDRKADQVWGQRELQKLQISQDPKDNDAVIRAAIRSAQDLTLEQQRLTGAGG